MPDLLPHLLELEAVEESLGLGWPPAELAALLTPSGEQFFPPQRPGPRAAVGVRAIGEAGVQQIAAAELLRDAVDAQLLRGKPTKRTETAVEPPLEDAMVVRGYHVLGLQNPVRIETAGALVMHDAQVHAEHGRVQMRVLIPSRTAAKGSEDPAEEPVGHVRWSPKGVAAKDLFKIDQRGFDALGVNTFDLRSRALGSHGPEDAHALGRSERQSPTRRAFRIRPLHKEAPRAIRRAASQEVRKSGLPDGVVQAQAARPTPCQRPEVPSRSSLDSGLKNSWRSFSTCSWRTDSIVIMG